MKKYNNCEEVFVDSKHQLIYFDESHVIYFVKVKLSIPEKLSSFNIKLY